MSRPDPVRVETTCENGCRIVRLDGELDLATVAIAEPRLTGALDGAAGVVIDLGGLTFMDSSGLRLMDALRHRAESEAIPLVLVPTPAIGRLLHLVGLDTVMRLADRVDDAVIAVRATPVPADPAAPPVPG